MVGPLTLNVSVQVIKNYTAKILSCIDHCFACYIINVNNKSQHSPHIIHIQMNFVEVFQKKQKQKMYKKSNL